MQVTTNRALEILPEIQQELNNALLDTIAMQPDRETITSLLEAGADVNCHNSKTGHTPLTWAALNNSPHIVTLLIAHGANLKHFKDPDCSLIHWLCSPSPRISSLLTLLHHPVMLSKEERELVCKTLEQDKYSPLDAASLVGDSNRVTELLKGVTPKCFSEIDGKLSITPLQWATLSGHKAIIEALLDHGALISKRDDHKNTLLHLAALKDHAEAVELFIARRFRADIHNNDGYTAWGLAYKLDHQNVLAVFDRMIPSTQVSMVSKAGRDNKLDKILPLLPEKNIMRHIISYLMGKAQAETTS